MEQMLTLQEKIIRDTGGSSTVSVFLNSYRKIQQERYENGEIKLNTLKQKASLSGYLMNVLVPDL